MKKLKLFGIALLLALGIVFLAQGRVAWANNVPEQDSIAENNDIQAVAAKQDNENDDDPGSVKPPSKVIVIKKSGTYSIGGFCTMTVELNAEKVRAQVFIERPLPKSLPSGVRSVRQGCRVTYYDSRTRLEVLLPEQGNAKICFAAAPKKDNTIYFYNVYGESPVWVALETEVEKGIACADGNGSGTYVVTVKK